MSMNKTNDPPPYPTEKTANDENITLPDPLTANVVTAVQYGYYDRVVELIEKDPNLAILPESDGVTLLHWAALNNHREIANYLINKGAKIDAIGGNLQSTPLHWAVREGKTDMVVFLLSSGAQLSIIDGEGYSCLHLACVFGHSDIAAYLVAKGENIDLPDKQGSTALMHAAANGYDRDPTQLIVRLGASINYQNPTNKYTALHCAIAGNNREAIRVLLHAGAKTNLRTINNDDAFDLAGKQNKGVLFTLAQLALTRDDLSLWFRFSPTFRRIAMKLLPYLVIIGIAFALHINVSLLYRGLTLLGLIIFFYGYSMIFFDENVHRNIPIAIAQASIFWLYFCYVFVFSQYTSIFNWIALGILTYFSWTSFYRAQKHDPGFIFSNRDQQHRLIIQLVEQNSFNYETFCTYCLIRRPLRSKHCRECHRCVSKFDHHCPWIDNCVGEKNLSSFAGFVFFTPLCLCFFLYGSYLYFRDHCHIFESENIFQGLLQALICGPAVIWLTSIAALHLFWITGLCVTILSQVALGFTTNERMNSWRYKYLQSKHRSPFSFGLTQNFVDLINRRVLFYTPINIDWTRIYSLDDYYESLPSRLRRGTQTPLNV